MNVAQLITLGGFVGAAPVKVPVSWTRFVDEANEDVTDNFDVFVLKTSFGNVEKMWTSGDEKSKSAILITECLRFGENGEERLSYEQAYSLDPGLAAELMTAYNTVNSRRNVPKT